jgi:hypothetical protein
VEVESETAREITNFDAGLVVKPDDPHELLAAVTALATDHPTQQRLGFNGRTQAEQFLSANAALSDLEVLLTERISVERPLKDPSR